MKSVQRLDIRQKQKNRTKYTKGNIVGSIQRLGLEYNSVIKTIKENQAWQNI